MSHTIIHGPNGISPQEANREWFWLVSPTGQILIEHDEDPRPAEEMLRWRLTELETLLGNLFRCPHGRKAGDTCSGETGCNGPSKGGPLQGEIIGHTLDGRAIRLPTGSWMDATNPEDWPKEEIR